VNRDERRDFVRTHRTAVFGYGRKSDGPAQSIVYYVTDGDDILVSTMGARAKAKAVARLGKVSLCVLEEGAKREGRVVLRLRPYQTFHSPPKHVHQASDVDEKLLHGLGDSLPW